MPDIEIYTEQQKKAWAKEIKLPLTNTNLLNYFKGMFNCKYQDYSDEYLLQVAYALCKVTKHLFNGIPDDFLLTELKFSGFEDDEDPAYIFVRFSSHNSDGVFVDVIIQRDGVSRFYFHNKGFRFDVIVRDEFSSSVYLHAGKPITEGFYSFTLFHAEKLFCGIPDFIANPNIIKLDNVHLGNQKAKETFDKHWAIAKTKFEVKTDEKI